MFNIGAWDWIVLIGSLVGITWIGVRAAARVSTSSDFFLGGNRFGKVFMLFYAFGAGTSGNDAVGVSSKTFTNGLSGIWYQWLWLFATPFYWIIAPFFRRMRATTTGDFFHQRYGPSTAMLYTVVGVLQMTVNIGMLLVGCAATIEAVSGGSIPKNVSILLITLFFTVYTIAGGLAAAIVTDLIQGLLTVVLSFMILPFAWNAVGGMVGMREHIQDEAMFSLVAPGEINGFHIFIFGLNALIGIVTQPHIIGVCAGGRTELDGRVGFAMGNLLKRVCTVAWMLTGLCAVVYYADQPDIKPDLVYGTMARDLLPGVMPGLIGLFLLSLLTSVMDSCGAFMIACSGLFTQNIYRHVVREREERHYVLIGRIAALVIVTFSLGFAFSVDTVPAALEWFFRLQAMMGAAFWLGLFWRRTSAAGAWAGTLVAFAIMFATQSTPFHAWAVENLPTYMIWDDKFRVSWQMAAYLAAGFGVCIGVSLFTPRVAKEKLDRLYECLHTPVQDGEQPGVPFTLPEGVTPSAPTKLIDHPDLEIPKPTMLGMSGFLGLWVLVGLLIAFVYWLAGTGA